MVLLLNVSLTVAIIDAASVAFSIRIAAHESKKGLHVYVVQRIPLVHPSGSSFFATGDTALQNMHATRRGKPHSTRKGEKPAVPAK